MYDLKVDRLGNIERSAHGLTGDAAEVERLKQRCGHYEVKASDEWARAERAERQLAGAVEAIRTLRAYIGNIEGEGPIRYIEALELCDSFLKPTGGQYVLEADQPRGAICDAAAHLLRVLDRFDNAPVSAVDAMDRLRTALGGQCAAHPRKERD